MERLTVKGTSGLISLKDKSENGANQAIKCLSEYEDTGLTPPEIMELKERNTAKVPDYEGDGCDKDGNIIYDTWICPNCGEIYEVDYDDYEHCPKCGQAIEQGRDGNER